jgi:hypothetical protein
MIRLRVQGRYKLMSLPAWMSFVSNADLIDEVGSLSCGW